MAQITTDDLRQMEGQEGLILQGCGEPIQDWIDGINDLLTEEGILLNGSRFTNVSSFQHDGLTNLFFPFDGVELKIGALAMWRLQTHEQFGGTSPISPTAARATPSNTRTASPSTKSTPTLRPTWYPRPGATSRTRPTP